MEGGSLKSEGSKIATSGAAWEGMWHMLRFYIQGGRRLAFYYNTRGLLRESIGPCSFLGRGCVSRMESQMGLQVQPHHRTSTAHSVRKLVWLLAGPNATRVPSEHRGEMPRNWGDPGGQFWRLTERMV